MLTLHYHLFGPSPARNWTDPGGILSLFPWVYPLLTPLFKKLDDYSRIHSFDVIEQNSNSILMILFFFCWFQNVIWLLENNFFWLFPIFFFFTLHRDEGLLLFFFFFCKFSKFFLDLSITFTFKNFDFPRLFDSVDKL